MIRPVFPELPWRPELRLVFRIQGETLTALASRGSFSRMSRFSLAGLAPQALRAEVSSWIGSVSGEHVTVLLPRAEILQKELTFAAATENEVRQQLDTRLQQMVPFPIREMAWGLRMEPGAGQMEGLLFAAPEQKVQEMLSILAEVGIETSAAEVISEDQALLWAALENGVHQPCLVLEKDSGRILAAMIRENRLLFSVSFETGSRENGALEWLPEISLKMLEASVSPASVLLAGAWGGAEEERLQEHFTVPVAFFPRPLKRADLEPVPPSLYGALFSNRGPGVSLLSRQDKAARRQRQRSRFAAETATLVCAFAVLAVLYYWGHLQILTMAQVLTQKKIETEAGAAGEAERVLSILKVVNRAQNSKEEILVFMKETAASAPAGVRLRDLRVEGPVFSLTAEAEAYDDVSAMVDALNQTRAVSSAKVESTRLRKNRGQDAIEFEVSGKWTK